MSIPPGNGEKARERFATTLLGQVLAAARGNCNPYRIEQAYVFWAERKIRFHCIRHPNIMGTAEAEQVLTPLAVESEVPASTQKA